MTEPRRSLTGRELNRAWGVGAAHALYREDGKWFHHLQRFPGALFDFNGYVIFRTREDYQRSPYLDHGQDLHVPRGISKMPGYVRVR
jgi:5-methylcytosine-specific restriction protein A